MEHTALEFTFIEFDKNWTRAGTVQYIATSTAQVIVVAEGATGVKTTYWFKVPKNEIVLVSYNTNVAYIPAKCVKKTGGDKTRCQKG
ncbi:MAG: hypothetical protein OEQ29_15430 [Alphaproteobacteria bacterium]|nr:hypothetical protein [Alphaproteobacteria bacterium]